MWQWWFFVVCCVFAVCNSFVGSLQGLSYTVFTIGTLDEGEKTLSYEYCSQQVTVPCSYQSPSGKVLVRPSPTYPFAPVQVITYSPGLAVTNVVCAITTGICAYAFWCAMD